MKGRVLQGTCCRLQRELVGKAGPPSPEPRLPSATTEMKLSGQGREGETQRGFIFHF